MVLAMVLAAIFLACVAMLWNEGAWNNAVTLINVILAALLATNYFEPLASFADKRAPSYTYLCDFLSIWILFFASFTVLRVFTDAASNTQVRFKLPLEQAGRMIAAMAVGWVMVCFTLTTLHTAPLARTAFRGGFQAAPMSNNFFGLAPDRMWLGFVHKASQGAFADNPPRPFDPQGELIFKYGERREMFSKEAAMAVKP